MIASEPLCEPHSPADLAQHNCIVYTRLATVNEWQFQGKQGILKVKVTGNFQTNSSIGIREAVLSGLGIAIVPVWLLGDLVNHASLKTVLQEYQPTPLPIYAVHRRGRFQPAKVRCFIDYLASEFKLDPWVSDYGRMALTEGDKQSSKA